MGGCVWQWLSRRPSRRGQTAAEFALVISVFLLLVFGIFQAVLIYRAQLALNQAATDAARALSSQSSDGAVAGGNQAADAAGLAALRAAMTTLDLRNISGLCPDGTTPNYASTPACANGGKASGVDVFSDDGSGNPSTWSPVRASSDMTNSPRPAANAYAITLDNHYVYAPSSAQCPSDQFSLTNNIDAANPIPASAIVSGSGGNWNTCSLPWNGQPFDPTYTAYGNQNGRHDQRCDEDSLAVTIRYNYFSFAFPVHWAIQLTASTSLPLEPRQYLGNSASVQTTTGTCS